MLVQRLFRRIGEVSSLPTVAIRIIEVANDPSTGADDLLEAVQIDASMATRIVRTVNSSYYALQNKVGDLRLAISLLGFNEVRNLAMTAYVAQLFKRTAGHATYSREGLWNHLIGVAMVSRMIAQTSGRVPPREAYLAGLLHDLGLILIDQYLHEPFCRVLDASTPERPTCDIEYEILGFDHTELGEYVALEWRLPGYLPPTIRYHHRPEEYVGDDQEMVYVVALANFFCTLKGLTSLGIRHQQMPSARLITGLGLTEEQVADIWAQLDGVLESADVLAMI
ncbi:MAG: HDOD domain-containing protein [Pirellulales bacterium]|nr:HDOD domain-containing protein [Pirellulales bacterium]